MTAAFSDHAEFRNAIAVGDYHRALGVSTDAPRLQIDAAASRLARRMPDEAGTISAIASLLTRKDNRPIYDSLRKLQRGSLWHLTKRCSPDCVDSLPDIHRFVWRKSCELFHFTLDDVTPTLGPRGAQSLAWEGQRWIIDSALTHFLPQVVVNNAERRAGVAERELWHANCKKCDSTHVITCPRTLSDHRAPCENNDHINDLLPLASRILDRSQHQCFLPKCRDCGGRLATPWGYLETCRFAVPKNAARGCVIAAADPPGSTNRFAIIGRVDAPHPPCHLEELYAAHAKGEDLTLAEVRSNEKFQNTVFPAVMYIILVLVFFCALSSGILDRTSDKLNRTPAVPGEKKVPSFQAVQWRSAAIATKLHVIEIAAGQDPTDAKLQAKARLAIAHHNLELADLYDLANFYSPYFGNERPREHRQKAIEILEPLVNNHPSVELLRNMLARAHCSLDDEGLTRRQLEERAVEMLEQLIADNPDTSLYQRMLERARSDLNKEGHVPNDVE